MKIKKVAKTALTKCGIIKSDVNNKFESYIKRYNRYAFSDVACDNYEQYEAVITRWYHTIEKGLSYRNYRPGFGKENIEKLLILLEAYEKEYDTSAFFYRTALSCLHEYIEKNREYGVINFALSDRVNKLQGEKNECGGVIHIDQIDLSDVQKMNFEEVLKNRHSIREFSDNPVEIDTLKNAITLSQHTPSACNRQGWRTRIIADKSVLGKVLENQNGNRGFGEGIDKLLLITCDLRYFNKKRELFQPFIDGGMYASNVINSLFYYGIGSIPLSASLSSSQEKCVRQILDLSDTEVLIIFIGVGNYPKECLTARSERKDNLNIEVI